MAMSDTESILPETVSFAAKQLHHEERANSYPENTPNFTNPLDPKIEAGNDTLKSKEYTSKPDRLDFVEETRKEIGAHEIDKNWNLIIRRELNGKENIMSIWSFKIKRSPDSWLTKQKSCLHAHGGMYKLGVNYWDTYSPVFIWISARSILTISILRDIHTKSVDFILAYTQADEKLDIFMELPICFGVEGAHPR